MARDPQTRGVVEAVRALYRASSTPSIADGRGLWLEGDVGTGKTTLAMLVSKRAIEAGHSVAIYSLPRLLARIRRTYDGDAGELSYLEFFERLTSVDLLHIDDLGAEKRSDWVLEQLYAIVDERYATNRSMHRHHEPRSSASSRSRSASARSRGWPRCARRCRCTATIAATRA